MKMAEDALTKNLETSRKRARSSVTENNVNVSKKLRLDDSEFANDLPDKSQLQDDETDDNWQTKQYIPRHLIELMYRLDLSVLCSLRKSMHSRKYPSLSLAFANSESEKFSNIILRYGDFKSVHVQIENVDKYYTDNCINYAKLFTKEKEKRHFFLNEYFDSFVKHLIPKLNGSLNDVEYLVVYTNSELGLTEEKTLKKGRAWSFYPFKFDTINMEEGCVLKDFLYTNDNEEGRVLYKFLPDETARGELLKRLQFSPSMRKVMEGKKLCEDEVKLAFLDKLIFAVNQPNREELNSIVRSEINESSKVRRDYVALRRRVLRRSTDPRMCKKLAIISEFNLLLLYLHDMSLYKNMTSINFEGKNCDICGGGIAIDYRGRTTYVKAHYYADGGVGYSQLFPSVHESHMFSVNKHFAFFAEGLSDRVRYFIIYTNADLDLTEEGRLKKGRSKGFYPFKFDSIDIQKKKYKILRYSSCMDENGLYRFSQEETTRLSSMLKLPPSLQKEKIEGRLSDEKEEELKEKFLAKLILAVNQSHDEKLDSITKNEIDECDKVPNCNYEELHEIALRWSESHEFGPITKVIAEKLLQDIKNNRSSYRGIRNKNIDDEIKFAKSVVGRVGTPSFDRFLDFLIKAQGKECLNVLKRHGINLTSVSSMLNKAGSNAAKAFKELYALWFDVKGNKKGYLKTLEKEAVNLANMSSILNGAGSNAAKAFQDLYDLWFDQLGNKSRYLKSLGDEGVSLARMSSVLNGAGTNAAQAFVELYDLWFDKRGNKTLYLKSLEKESVNLARMSSVLNGAGTKAAKAFVELYDLWFDERGNKRQYLKTLEREGVSLASTSCILSGAGVKASTAFEELYYLWFDTNGSKKQCLKTLMKEGVSLANMSSILSRTAANAAKAFKELYDLWFDTKGNRKRCLTILEGEGVTLNNISSVLHGAAGHAAKAFKDLFNRWFDVKGNKKQRLKHFVEEKNGEKCFTIQNVSSILNGSGANVKDAFDKLHGVCFNGEGKRMRILDDFYNADFQPSHLSCILCGTGVHASIIFMKLHNVCFDDEGKKTRILDDFCNAGFEPAGLCNILSGAADRLQEFHDFCFTRETKKYLNNFLNHKNGFTPSNLSDIMHGARTNICHVFKEFHDVCFDEMGEKSQLFVDFYDAGFKAVDLSNVLSMAGNNASSILKNFHKMCFVEDNYLDDFLAEEELFTPKDLCRILRGVGLGIRSIFRKLHNLCFDESGNRTDYLDSLTKNEPPYKVLDVLYGRVRNGVSLRQVDIDLVEASETEYDDEQGGMGLGSQAENNRKQRASLKKSISSSRMQKKSQRNG